MSLGRRSAAEEIGIDPGHRAAHGGAGEEVCCSGSAGSPHAGPPFRVVEEGSQGLGKVCRVAWLDQQTSYCVLNELRDATRPGFDASKAGSHRFGHDDTEPLSSSLLINHSGVDRNDQHRLDAENVEGLEVSKGGNKSRPYDSS